MNLILDVARMTFKVQMLSTTYYWNILEKPFHSKTISYCPQVIYGIVTTALCSKFLLHISMKNITKTHNVCLWVKTLAYFSNAIFFMRIHKLSDLFDL